MKTKSRILLASVIFSLFCATAFGQAVSQIAGTAKDPSGAVVPGVDITATQTDTGLKRTTTTDSSTKFIGGAKEGSTVTAESVALHRGRLGIGEILTPDHDPDRRRDAESLLAAVGIGAKGAEVEPLGLDGPFVGGSLATRTKVFSRIEEFLNFNLYDFAATVGNLKVLDEPAAPVKK